MNKNTEQQSILTAHSEDVEGHWGKVYFIDGPQEETEDVEAHGFKVYFVNGTPEDVEGHKFVLCAHPADDDVEGHMQPPRDLDVER